MIKRILLILVFCLCTAGLCAQEDEAPVKKHYIIAASEIGLQNAIVHLFDRFVLREDYAQVTWQDIGNNITGSWYWDENEFLINQIGHPYQGMFYFTASRSANLNFWESAAYTAFLGSLPWEYLTETEQPAYNDLITTTLGGTSLGEMFHRLFEDSWDSNFRWLSYIISPMDGFNRNVFRWSYKKPTEKTEKLNYFLFAGAFDTDFVFGTGLDIVYGQPFGHNTKEPFDSFEFSLKAAFSQESYYFYFFSDGYLWSYAPLWGINAATTLGISLHYDFIYSKKINYSDNSIGLTFKRRCHLPHDYIFDIKLHLNWLILGTAEDNRFINGEIERTNPSVEKRNYYFCTGENVKLHLTLAQEKFGLFTLWGMFSGLHHIEEAVMKNGTGGFTAVINWGTSYEYNIYKQFSVGASYEMLCKNGFYTSTDDVSDLYNFYSIYGKLKIR